MTVTLVLAVLGVALFLSLIALAVVLPIRPGIVRVTERLVCPAGTRMEVEMVRHSYHRSGERGIVVRCRGQGRTEQVNGRALVALWLIFYLASLPVAAVVVVLVNRWIAI